MYKTLKAHNKSVNALDFSNDGKIIASASNDKKVKLWNRDGTLLKTLEGHQSVVWDVSISPDNQMIASASNDETVKLWSTDGKLLKTFKGHNDVVRAVAFSDDGTILASASDDGTVKLWQLGGTESLTILKHSFDKLDGVNFDPNGQRILTARGYGDITFWSDDGKYLETKPWHSAEITTFKFSPDGKLIVSADQRGSVKLSTTEDYNQEYLKGHTGELKKNHVLAVSFSPKSQTFVIGDTTGKIEIWKRDGSLLNTIQAHQRPVLGLSFSQDGEVFASGSGDGTAKLWNINGSLKRTLLDNDNDSKLRVFGVAFSPDQHPDKQIIAAITNKHQVKLLNRDGEELAVLKGHKKLVTAVAFSPDGKQIATASHDQTVKLWERNGKVKTTFYGHNDHVIGLAFSPDGNRIASASEDKTVLLWDVDIKQDLAGLKEYTCIWMQNYLKNNTNLEDSDRKLCNSIKNSQKNNLKTFYKKLLQKFQKKFM